MRRGSSIWLGSVVVLAGWGLLSAEKVTIAQQIEADAPSTLPFVSPDRDESHSHAPIDVDLRPIVSRFKVTVLRPRRMLLDPTGNLFVADWEAGTLLKIDARGDASVIADGLNEPSGLARDDSGNLYVATHAEGMTRAGTVVKISESGEQSLFIDGLTGPTGLVFDEQGNLFIANFHDDSIMRVGPDGRASIFAENVPGPAALTFDDEGHLFVASSTEGTLFRFSPSGEAMIVTRGLQIPSDLAFDSEGHLIVANFGGTELSYVNDRGEISPFAVVPKGTICLTFDPEGNLLLANWEYQFVLKVTTNLSIPCPHCGKRIPIRLRSKQQGDQESDKSLGPVI